MPKTAKPDEIFQIERHGDTLIITPQTNLLEFEFQNIQQAAKKVLDLLDRKPTRNVVLDFHKTDFYVTSALAFFLKVWKRVRSQGGHMALCNVSTHELEVLQITKLDELWPICSSREEALRAVQEK